MGMGDLTLADVNRSVRVRLPRRLDREGANAGEQVWVRGKLAAPADERGRVVVNVFRGDRVMCQVSLPAEHVERWEEPFEDGSPERPYKMWL
jgi:hypothetical protein